MSSTQRLAVAAVALALIGVGLYLINADEPGPTPVAVEPTAPRPEPSRALAAPSVDEPSAPPPVAAAQAPLDAGPVAPPERFDPSAPAPPAEPSPFEGSDSKELQYAVKLVTGEGTGPFEWNKAYEVFQRCIDQNRFNHLCRRGLAAAYERLTTDGGPTTLLSAPVIVVEPLAPTAPTMRDRGLPERFRQQ